MLDTLQETLGAVGKPSEVYQSPDGSRILLLPYGGRVLGLFAPGQDDNFYWTHPALESVAAAREFYASDQWHNSGGDRTWLSPEADIFFPKFPDLSTYFQPRQLDPGPYRLDPQGEAFRLVNRLSLTLTRSRITVDLEIAKSFGPAPNPLRYERGLQGLEHVEYAGYTQHTSLEMFGDAQAQVGLWNLVQMEHGGELLIPTYIRAEPKIYFNSVGAIPPEDLLVTDHLVCYKMRQNGEHKLGVRAVSTAGRVGYLYEKLGRWGLIIRSFFVDPSGEYVDVPWRDTADLGYSVQACNVNSSLGQFSELEYHVPAVGLGTGRTRCTDASRVWAFRGSQQPILTVARALLSPEVIARGIAT